MADISGALSDLAVYAADLRTRAAEAVLNDTIANTPVSEHQPGQTRTPGTLRDSTNLKDPGDDGTVFSVTIIADTDYAEFVDEGTAPHEIVGNPTLTFWWPDGFAGVGFYTFRHVQHPGTEARRYFSEPMPDRWETALRDEVRQ